MALHGDTSPERTRPVPIPRDLCSSSCSLLRFRLFLSVCLLARIWSMASWQSRQSAMRFSRRRSCLSRGLPSLPSAYGAPIWWIESIDGFPHCSQHPPAMRRIVFVTFFQLEGYLSLLILMTVLSLSREGPFMVKWAWLSLVSTRMSCSSGETFDRVEPLVPSRSRCLPLKKFEL